MLLLLAPRPRPASKTRAAPHEPAPELPITAYESLYTL